jgi:hypothetical protein
VHAFTASILVAACTHLPATPSALAFAHDPDVLSSDEFDEVQEGSAYDLIRRLRPAFLSYRGPTTILGTATGMPTVYVDGMRYGPFGILQQIPASWVAEVRLFRAASAGQFGLDNTGGVLMITTHKQ